MGTGGMIYENSRYEFDKVVMVTDHAGISNPAIYVSPDVDEQSFYYEYLTVTMGMRMDVLAHQVYGEAEKWWVIARANPEVFYPDAIPMGTRIRIPYGS